MAMNRIVAASRPSVDLGRMLQRPQVQRPDNAEHWVARVAAVLVTDASNVT